ncbi:hypothetical protein P354_19610 [Streptomyces noursei PD-1]|nr:hypothetical protein P354_19610 [Streptomyces noursei PD-1]
MRNCITLGRGDPSAGRKKHGRGCTRDTQPRGRGRTRRRQGGRGGTRPGTAARGAHDRRDDPGAPGPAGRRRRLALPPAQR